jgi:hypothetical protein
MPELPQTVERAFDFSELMAGASAGYIERPSLQRAIRDLAVAPAAGCCLVRGDMGSIPLTGYVHALGRCLRILVEDSAASDFLDTLWGARMLGSDGLYLLLGYLGPYLAREGLDGLTALVRAENEASELFGRE